ncbi:N-acetylgalactosamine kinase-like [Xenia sp. Carnegie-2017]|uniref:N-acetylgalactosamine kinase-like n=1 Tax=Xenia sp. Carnegie-2017 TaxID=2897299 RepID=UPI001F04F626|nr:N-acetylgalactosamine kinase-like [Xenia sp. Carnegie-2017]
MDETVPHLKDLCVVYPSSSDKAKLRLKALKKEFESLYSTTPNFYCRAPGRVNIIGEHIDYCGYGVLPMAIEQDIIMAVVPNDKEQIVLANVDKKFKSFSVNIKDYKIDGKEWFHYFLCGFKGITDHLGLKNPVGMSVLVDGNVPKNAGLSSSSAFVCCSGLATMHVNGGNLSKVEIAEVCTKCERYIGTEGGGMDQACSFLAGFGKAKHIEFDPLRSTDVIIPEGITFVIANSQVEMNKSKTAGTHFNVRVVECRTAAQVLAKAKGVDWKSIRKLSQVQKELGVDLGKMLEFVEEILHKGSYSRQEICKLLEITDVDLIKECLSESTAHVDSFKLYDRAIHVYSEAKRVLEFRGVCEQKPKNAVESLGNLMSESHDSCRVQYECSCEELDKLVDCCRCAGALGSRLTGAGWGGCTVSMVPNDAVDVFLKEVKRQFYQVDCEDPGNHGTIEQSLFATSPGGGAAIILPDAVDSDGNGFYFKL